VVVTDGVIEQEGPNDIPLNIESLSLDSEERILEDVVEEAPIPDEQLLRRCPTYDTYFKAVKKSGVRIRGVKQPYNCPTHRRAPVVRRRLDALNGQLADGSVPAEGSFGRQKFDEELQKLENELVDIERHERQFETQRAYLQWRETQLKPWTDTRKEIIVYEDFVCFYNLKGKKISNLVFTVI
jgi:hypothetical protein